MRGRTVFNNVKTSVAEVGFAIYLYLWLLLTRFAPIGENVYESDWDILIVLDACRVDALREVADEYDFIQDVDSIRSLGSTSKEWHINTFTATHLPEISETTLITSNGWADTDIKGEPDFTGWTGTERIPSGGVLERAIERDLVDASNFRRYQSMLSLGHRNPCSNTALPEDMTDIAIDTERTQDPSRLIVHYMQPHSPYIHNAVERGECTDEERDPFGALRNGADRDRIWEMYLDNLRYVLDSVEVLLNNVDAERVVITADHGELFGEWGLSGHIAGIPHPALRRVPWVETSATDRGQYSPTQDQDIVASTEDDVEEFLKDLGYV